MTSYTGFGSGTPSGIAYGGDTDRYTLGTAFKVTGSGYTLRKGRLYLHSNGGAVTAAAVLGSDVLKFTLYGPASGSGGAEGSPLFTAVTLGSLTMDAWNEFVLGTPYALTDGAIYYAAVYLPNGRYAVKSNVFGSDVVASPITFPADGSSQGVTGTVKNGAFEAGGTDIQPPTNSFNKAFYGIDVEISDGGSTVTGTAAASLGALTGAATGVRTVAGTASASLGRITAAAAGSRVVAGTATGALGALTAAATGRRTIAGTAAAALSALIASGSVEAEGGRMAWAAGTAATMTGRAGTAATMRGVT